MSSPTIGSVYAREERTQTECCFTHTCPNRVRLPTPPRGGCSSRLCHGRAASDPLCTHWLSQILRHGRPTLSGSKQLGGPSSAHFCKGWVFDALSLRSACGRVTVRTFVIAAEIRGSGRTPPFDARTMGRYPHSSWGLDTFGEVNFAGLSVSHRHHLRSTRYLGRYHQFST